MNGKPAGVEAALRKSNGLDRAGAEAYAVKALAFLAADDERLQRFLDLSGLEPSRIRAAAAEPGFLAGVLDHVGTDEALLLDLAASLGERPETIMAARRLLSPTNEG